MPLIYSILCNNRSFSLISRYKTTYKSYLRMVTDQPEAWTNAKTSHFPWSRCSPGILVECSLLARGASRWAAPAVLALGGLQLRKWGKGNNFGSCAIKFDLDSLRKFSGLLPEKNRPISGGLRKGLADLDDCGSVGYCDCVSGTDILLHSMPFQSYPPASSLLYTPLNQPSN